MSKKFQSKAVLASVLALALALPTGALAADDATANTTAEATDTETKAEDKKAAAAKQAAEDAEKRFYVLVTVDRNMLGLRPGDATLINATTKAPSDKEVSVVWSSSDPSVATVDKAGRVTALKVGECEIYASVGSIKATTRVYVSISQLNFDNSMSSATKSGYTNQIEIDALAKTAEVLPLAVFTGSWNNASGLLANEAVVKGLTVTTEVKGKKEVVKGTDALASEFKADFKSIEIKDGKISFVGMTASDDNAAVADSAKFEYAALDTVKADKILTANIYEAVTEGAPYQYLVFSPLAEAKDDKTADAFYLSYGDDLAALQTSADWNTMLVSADGTDAQLVTMLKDYEKPAKAALEGEAAEAAAAADSGAEEVADSGAEEVAE